VQTQPVLWAPLLIAGASLRLAEGDRNEIGATASHRALPRRRLLYPITIEVGVPEATQAIRSFDGHKYSCSGQPISNRGLIGAPSQSSALDSENVFKIVRRFNDSGNLLRFCDQKTLLQCRRDHKLNVAAAPQVQSQWLG
jgi:hypothetical protein